MPSVGAAFATRVRRAESVMGTVVSFDVPAEAAGNGSLAAAVSWLHWVDRIFSPYRPESDVSLLADAEVTVDGCAPEVAEVIAVCAAIRVLSGGYFTTAPWGRFDPSGYVKGWAVERAAAILSQAGSGSHLIDGGGDIQCAGGCPRSAPRPDSPPVPPPAGSAAGTAHEPWRVAIADPFRPSHVALVVEAWDGAIATSGAAQNGTRVLNPHTGQPASGLASVTVIGPRLAYADAYATAAVAMGPPLARAWTESLTGYEAYAITETGEAWQTSGFARHIARS